MSLFKIRCISLRDVAKSFYEPGDRRAARVEDLFSIVAPRYDLINDLQSFGLHRIWKRRLVSLAQVKAGDQVLDVCCGTGDMALRFARAGARVVGLDFSEPMIRIAEERARVHRQTISFVRGDALQLPFPDGEFDVVTVSYGLRNLASFNLGLSEMHRVLRPRGRWLILDFGKPRNRLVRAGYYAYLQHWVPVLGRMLCGDSAPYRYILESLHHYPAQDGVAAFMDQLRCRKIHVYNLLGGMMSINYGEKLPA